MKSHAPARSPDQTRRYEKLVTAHSAWLYRYAYWLSGNRHEAEDLVQETCLRAWRFIGSLKDDGAAKSWFTTILRRENARKYERKRLEYSQVEIDEVKDPQEDLDSKPEMIALRVALKELPLMYREPLILQVLGGYSLKEISVLFDIPANTAATRLHRARLKLREQLEGGEYILDSLCECAV